MQSRGFKYKEEVLALRRKGVSMTTIEREFDIPRSTLSGWFKEINLTEDQRVRLTQNSKDGWKRAREKAVLTHNLQKAKRVADARQNAQNSFKRLPKGNNAVLELALAMLYFGEGGKTAATNMGASDPFMLTFFITSLEKIYNLNRLSFRYDLHLRHDQDEEKLKLFWSQKLSVPIEKFKYVSKDLRTIGKPTRNDYHGVCQIQVGDISIQRRLMALYNVYCAEVIMGD